MEIKKLFRDYIIVELKTETKTAGGLLLSLQNQETQLTGVIKLVGKDVENKEDLVVGTTVLFDKLNSSPSPTGDSNERLIQEDDVIGLL